MLQSKFEPAHGARPSVAAPRPTVARKTAAKFADLISKAPLATSPARGAPRIPNEIAFLVHYGVSSARLAMAAQKARTQGVTADRVLIAEGHVTEVHFYRALARHLRVPFVDGLVKLHPDTRFGPMIAKGIAPLVSGQGAAFLLAPRGGAIPALIAATARREIRDPHFALTTPAHMSRLARSFARNAIQYRASFALPAFDADLCAKDGLSHTQLIVLTALACLFVFLLPLVPLQLSIVGTTIICLVILMALWLRLSACIASLRPQRPRSRSLSDAELPVYSIIIPLYREAKVLPQLLAALTALDYPRAKLDIKIVVEEDDVQMRKALFHTALPPFCDVIVAPDFAPRTKPRALNVALPLVRGSLVAVYDAEDIPEPQQLRLAASHFAASGPKLACLQARLAIDNLRDGLLARLFAIEYAGLFDVLNVGFAALGFPFPLGGSSNHFRTEILRGIGGWDAWNVTEDADIGLRLIRFGFDVAYLGSTTLEEAPTTLRGFFNQRRRWCKGWYQTLIVLWRRPIRLWRELGPVSCVTISLVVMCNIVGGLAAPLFVVGIAVDAWLGTRALPSGAFGNALAGLWGILVLAGLPALVVPGVMGMKRRKILHAWPLLALLPFYVAIISAAAWTAIVDLARHPYYWFKTEHGMARRGQAPRPQVAMWRPALQHWRLKLSKISK